MEIHVRPVTTSTRGLVAAAAAAGTATAVRSGTNAPLAIMDSRQDAASATARVVTTAPTLNAWVVSATRINIKLARFVKIAQATALHVKMRQELATLVVQAMSWTPQETAAVPLELMTLVLSV